MKKPTQYRRLPTTEFEENYLIPRELESDWKIRFHSWNRIRGSDPRMLLVHALVQGMAFNNLASSPKEYANAVCDTADAIFNEMLARKFVALDPTLDELDAMANEDFGHGVLEENSSKLGF